jgi:predicted HD phosphohydrolase
VHAPKNVSELFELYELYEAHGSEPYGEAITQTEHALQCASLARGERASDAMIAAALFHDVGHLAAGVQNGPDFRLDADDDDHEAVGARVLAPLFGPSVAGPVSMHVTAKRWRCSTDPRYFERLSEASKMTLKAQGGLLSEEECLRFEEHPGFPDALALRTWDDEGKIEGLDVGVLADYEGLISSLAAAWSRARRER